MRLSLTIRKLRSVMAFGLTLWCAGAGCLLVSYVQGAAMPSAKSDTNASSSMEMMGHACCKARHGSRHKVSQTATSATLEQIEVPPTSSSAMSCCPLTSGSFVTSSRGQSNNDDNTDIVHKDITASSSFSSRPVLSRALLRLPDQNHTYLRVCAFLI